MSDLQLYAVHGGDLTPLPVAPEAHDVHELFLASMSGHGDVSTIYSALRSYHGDRFLRLPAHFERSRLCVERAGWTTRFAFEGLARAVAEAVARRQGAHSAIGSTGGTATNTADVRLRFDLLERPTAVLGTTTQVLLGVAPHEPVAEALLQTGVLLRTTPSGLARPQPRIKFGEWVNTRQICWDQGESAYEYLLLDEEQRILEGTSSNFYAVKGRHVITAGDGVLEGITRALVLELIAARGLQLELHRLPLDELSSCDEAFITSSTREVVPVREVSGTILGDGDPGPVTRTLMEDYSNYTELHAKPALPFES